jgi:alkanesulfonate monooxygenase SsuD/methylene tetrahydromethanopterin reductase-like flavin-dependent oxidoreductase (luciferase family)
MELGLFMMPLHPDDRPVAETYKEDMDRIILADQLGYAEAWVGQHYTASVEPIANPLMFMAAAIPQTKNIKLCSGVLNLPCHHPATVAAEAAQFDHMSQGRFIMGIGPGALATDFQLFDNEDGWPRLRKCMESIEVIQKIWNQGPPYSHEGEFFKFSVDKNIVRELGTGYMQKPFQLPSPPIATSLMSPNPGLGKIAGERGWIPVSANFIPIANVATHWLKYVEGCEAAGRRPDPSIWRVARNIVVARTDEEAREVAMDPKGGLMYTYNYLWKALSLGGFTSALKSDPSVPDEEMTTERLVDDLCVIGSPKTVAEKLISYQEDVTGPFGSLILGLQDWGHNYQAEANSMKLLATDVLPILNRASKLKGAA